MDRRGLINQLIKTIHGTDYLEIGIRKGCNLAEIRCENKTGVDPFPRLDLTPPGLVDELKKAKIYTVTSDEFFKNCAQTFDVIFVDGLHQYAQALRDIMNALNVLKKGGFVVVHDCNPITEHAATPYLHEGEWNGDVWKAIYQIGRDYKTLQCMVLEDDYGLGIIWKRKKDQTIYHAVVKEEIASLPYEFLEKNRKAVLHIQSYDVFYRAVIQKKWANFFGEFLCKS